jgi:hypothetical protein
MLYHGSRYCAVVGRDRTAPALVSATVDLTGVVLTLVFSEAVTAVSWDGLVSVTGDITSETFFTLSSGNGTATVVMDSAGGAFLEGETLALDYAGPGVEDLAGNDLADIANASVTNNSEFTG